MKANGDGDFLNKKTKREPEVKCWFCTWPRCNMDMNVALKHLVEKTKGNIEEYLIAQEHHEDGGRHLHAYIKLKKKRRFKADMFDIGDYHGHYEPCKSSKAVQIYCQKEEDYIANFALDVDQKKIQRAAKNKMLLKGDINKLVEEGEISIMIVPTIYKARNYLNMSHVPPKIIERKCYWIYGKPRIGKSYLVREAFDPYEKSLNKWWDGYINQELVLIDDLDDKAKVLGHHLKIWADNYRFLGETKGGTLYPVYKCLIITSNYLPNQIWDDMMLVEAISARFMLIEMEEREQQKEIQEIIKKELNN